MLYLIWQFLSGYRVDGLGLQRDPQPLCVVRPHLERAQQRAQAQLHTVYGVDLGDSLNLPAQMIAVKQLDHVRCVSASSTLPSCDVPTEAP